MFYNRPCMRTKIASGAKPWAAAALSAALLELPFPLAGPMPPWRSIFAWFGLVPLLWALLSNSDAKDRSPLRRGFLIGYLCGFLWYIGNCYWIRDTMSHYGDMPPLAPTLLLIGFSLVLGLYFGLFGLGLVLVRRATGSVRWALLFAPFLWTALELAAARITSVPWDQLGYSQVDNALVNQLAPWTGVYGISFLLVAANAFLAEGRLAKRPPLWTRPRSEWLKYDLLAGAWMLMWFLWLGGIDLMPRAAPTTATAVLIQPNLDVGDANNWQGPDWDRHIAEFTRLATEPATKDTTYFKGIPQTGAALGETVTPTYPTHPDLVAWPESPAPFFGADPRFQQAMKSVAQAAQAPLVVGGVGMDLPNQTQGLDQSQAHTWLYYNSAFVFAADGQPVGRYNKIHLVPFGEYIPFQNLLTFAHKLTGRVGMFERGTQRDSFLLPVQNQEKYRYGIFICYEAVFADEVRQFARHGAEVFVNISDDGWYGDTSAPWQHLNMARMRAIENRRWLLRDTNSGVTAAIDPNGVVRQSISRHQAGELEAEFGFRNDLTFYTVHGDVFAWLCLAVSLGLIGWAAGQPQRRDV